MEKKITVITERIDDHPAAQCHDADGSAHSAESTSTSPLEAAGIGLGMGGDHLAIVHPLGRDHRKVRGSVNQRRYMLEQCGIEISDTDFTDDRLAIVLRQLSQEPTWQAIEQNLSRDTMRIYDLPVQQVRGCYHHVSIIWWMKRGCFSLDIKTTPVCLSSKRCWQT